MLRALLSMTAISILCACPPEPTAEKKPQALKLAPEPAEAKPIVPVTKRPSEDPHQAHGPPEFVKRGSGVFEDNGKRWFYGTGHAKGISNMMRAHVLADKAANAELLNLLRAYNKKVIDTIERDALTDADNFAMTQLKKAEIVDHWIDHDGDAWHSLRRLDAERYADDLAKLLNLTAEDRKKVGPP